MIELPFPDDSCVSGLNLINGLDICFQTGFARLAETEKAGLEAMVPAFSGTPLEIAVADAVAGLKQGRYSEKNFAILAAARTSLSGAVYDALIQELDKSFSITRIPSYEENFEDSPLKIQSGVSHILTELAVTGFSQVSGEMLESFHQTSEQLSDEPSLIRLSALLNGFINEMKTVSSGTMEQIPVTRWTDLWTRAMIMTLKVPKEPATGKKSGELFILGIDAPRHPSFVTLNFYGILTDKDKSSLTTFSLSSHTVDSIVQNDIWLLFDRIPVLKESLAKGLSIKITDMPALENNILLWDDKCAKKGSQCELFEKAVALSDCERTKIPASERHPVHINELLFIDKYLYKDGKIFSANPEVKVDLRRLISFSPIDSKTVKGMHRAVGILRYDSEWLFQPLAIEKIINRKFVVIHNGQNCLDNTKAGKKQKENNVAILRERASRLLRK